MNFLKKHFTKIIFLAVFIFSLRGIYGEDIWFHLSTGKFIFINKYIPLKDVFSFTAAGKNWINQNWLADLSFFLVKKYFGDSGLALFFSLTVTLIFITIYAAAVKLTKNRFLLAIGIFFLAFFSIFRFQARPETGSYLAIAVIFYLLLERKRPYLRLLLPLLFLFWANWQTGFVAFGFYIFGIYVLWDFIQKYRKKKAGLTLKETWSTLMLFIGSILASLINPLGLKGILYFFAVQPAYLISDFTEWGSLLRILNSTSIRDIDFNFLFAGYLLFIICLTLLLAWLWQKKELNIKKIDSPAGFLLLTAPLILIPFIAYRFIPIALISIYFIIIFLSRDFAVPEKGLKKYEIYLSVVIILMFFFRLSKIQPFLSENDNKKPMRDEAISYIKKNNLQGNIFNPLEDGGYFIWQYPERKVFIDQRLDVYTTSGVYQDYRKVYSFPPQKGWQKALSKYNVQIILLPGWQDEPYKTIAKSGDYVLTFWSDYFFLLVKRNGTNAEFAQKNGIKYLEPFKSEDYEKNNLPAVVTETKHLITLSPKSSNLKIILGSLYHQNEELEKAIEELEKALTINKNDNSARLFLGNLYVEDQQCDLALQTLEGVNQKVKSALGAIAYRNMGLVWLDCLGNPDKAYHYLSKFVQLGRKVSVDPSLLNDALNRMNYILNNP